ncbi:MAG TPA: alpha-glucan family phosphorylase [Acetobacteraceae bacterium]|nr:alpha-glucan family phosphorylase [Acetobacteraceae bacterium]
MDRLPPRLAALRDLALDLRWTWNHAADPLWERIDAVLWQRTHNPWTILTYVSTVRLNTLASDSEFLAQLDALAAERQAYLHGPTWFGINYGASSLGGVAYFSMEFGLGDALPLYAGGLGILAADFLKTASDLGLPLIGIGLLFQQGYFRQMIDATGRQQEAYVNNQPSAMPIEPVWAPDGSRFVVTIPLPGRHLRLLVWRAAVGRTALYLLDSNDPLNSAVDQGITGQLYGGGSEMRLAQEIVLGVGGWRVVEALHPEIEICHANEGHAGFAVLERARSYAARSGLRFAEALWATRAGNVFTTHTPVAAAFDKFPIELLAQYAAPLNEVGVGPGRVLAMGRAPDEPADAPLNMAYLGVRGALWTCGVSRLHGEVSRHLFAPLFPRWPAHEVPITHITNGVHVPTWDSRDADDLWTEACGKDRWRGMSDELQTGLTALPDGALWAMRGRARQNLVASVRGRLEQHLSGRGRSPEAAAVARSVLDPNVLTLGFARRFTAYKRPNLLLRNRERLARILRNEHRPAQIVVAGKAHPADEAGKHMIQEWFDFAQDPAFRHRVVLLEDYDISLAQELVQGVDVWINTPRLLWEACGTSGMKVLVNGGLNVSVRDGWWEEAYTPDAGWMIGANAGSGTEEQDGHDAEALYDVLEHKIVPEFYTRDAAGVPGAWLARIRCSMANLTPQYSSTRMAHEYLRAAYLPGARALRRRMEDGAARAKEMAAWERRVRLHWRSIHVADPAFVSDAGGWCVTVPIYLGEMDAGDIAVEIYAEPADGDTAVPVSLAKGKPIEGAANSFLYIATAPAGRFPHDYTVRVLPYHPDARVPTELALVLWQK